MMNMPKTLLPTVIATLVVALTGCGDIGRSATAEGLTTQEQATERQADKIYEQIWGNAEQKDAGEYLSHLGLNRPIAACMNTAGFDYRSDFVTLWAGYQTNGTSGRRLGHLGVRPSDTELALAKTRRVERAPAKSKLSKGYSAALDKCQSAADGVDLAALGTPEETESLSAAYTRMLEGVEQALGPIDGYTACMADHGIDLSGIDTEGWEALYLYLSGEMPDPPLPKEQPSAAWRDYLDLEAKAVGADETCRAGTYTRGLDLLPGRLDQFEADHADELNSTAQGWQHVEQTALGAGLGKILRG